MQGVIPTPNCQLFQIHGSIFKPDPSCNGSQTSVMCITHSVFFFCISKYSLNGFFSLLVDFFCFLRLSQLLNQVEVFLPNVCGQYFLPFFVRSTHRPTWTIHAVRWGASVCAFSISVCCSVAQRFAFGTYESVLRLIIGVVPRLKRILFSFVSCVRQNRDPAVF